MFTRTIRVNEQIILLNLFSTMRAETVYYTTHTYFNTYEYNNLICMYNIYILFIYSVLKKDVAVVF